MKKELLLLLLFITVFFNTVSGQTYRIVDVNASKFPFMEARILAYDVNYSPDSLKEEMVSIYENDQAHEILEYKPPKSSIIPTSIVIILDVSASMVGTRFDILKKTAKEFIQNLPLEISEVAIASFSDDISLNCDFTHNIQILNQSIDLLNTLGGTNFDKAFLNPIVGAVNIARQGQYKRVVIFFTDGLSDVKHYEVSNKAIYDSTIVNCLTIGLPISDELKYIAEQTGGNYYSELIYESQIRNAFEKIYTDIQVNTYGKIRWRSDYSCKPDKNTLIKLGNEEFTLSYQIPDSLIGNIEVTPSTLNFDTVKPGNIKYKPVFIRGNNIGLNIASITNNNNSIFGIKNIYFPLRTEVDELKMIEFSFAPKDSIYAISQFTVVNPGCPDINIEVATSGVKKLVITEPNGDEVFVRGNNIPISWKGINKSSSVDFYYQIKGQADWYSIGASTQYKKNWIAPALNETIRIQGQVTNNITLSNLLSSTLQKIDNEGYMSSYFSPDGNEIITLSKTGRLKSWDAQNGLLRHDFEKLHFGDVAFFPDYNRVVTISDSTFEVFTNRNGLEMVTVSLGEKKVLASFTHVHDKELYTKLTNYYNVTQSISHLPGGSYLDGTNSQHGVYGMARNNSVLTIFRLQALKRWFSIPLNEGFRCAVLHNSEPYVALVNDSGTDLYNLNSKQLLKEFIDEQFLQYSASGRHIITQNSTHIFINELKSGTRILSIPISSRYTLSKNGKYIAFVNNDSLNILNLDSKIKIYQKLDNENTQLQFFPETDRLLFLQKDSLTILNFQMRKEEMSVYARPNLVKMMDIAPNEKSILITSDKVLAVWDIKKYFDADSTPYFNIFSPQPEVAQTILFPKQFVNISSEKVFSKIIRNRTPYRVVVDSVYIESSDTDFKLVSSHGSMQLNSNEAKSVEIRFTPKTVGIISANLIIVSGDKKYRCTITGEGINQSFEIPTPLIQFPDILVGTTCDTIMPILINTGTEPLIIKTIELAPISNNNFELAQVLLPKKLFSSDTLWSKVTFQPKSRGRQNANLRLKFDTKEWIKVADIYGVGVAKRVVILAGKTTHVNSGKALASVITITELNSGKITNQEPTNKDGTFAIKVNTDLNYSVSAQLPGFFSSSMNVDLSQAQTADTIWADIELTPIVTNSIVRLNNIFFEFAKADLLDISKTEIRRIIKLMNEQPELKIEIQGHTDNIGGTDANLQLSKMRANAVKMFMVAENMEAQRITISYYGEEQPLQDNSNEAGRKANRRVEIKFLR